MTDLTLHDSLKHNTMSYTLGENLGYHIRHFYHSYEAILDFLPEDKGAANLAKTYQNWWIDLLHNDPVHVFIETLLLVFITYLIFFKRSKDWKLDYLANKDHLSEEEKEELIEEWTPAPLCDVKALPQSLDSNIRSEVVVHKMQGTKLEVEYDCRKMSVLNFAGHDFLGMGSSCESLKEASRKTMKKYG